MIEPQAAITCETCSTQLDAHRVESYLTPVLCDDCNLDRALELDACLCLDCSDTPLEQRPAPLEAY